MVVHYFITLQPAAADCVTCFSILVYGATKYSFPALLHLIRTACVPPNNVIMTGTGWCLVQVLSASWPSARTLEWESLFAQIWHSCECQGTMVLIRLSTSPPGFWRGFGLVGDLIVKYFAFYSMKILGEKQGLGCSLLIQMILQLKLLLYQILSVGVMQVGKGYLFVL